MSEQAAQEIRALRDLLAQREVESRELRTRVTQLESTIDACLATLASVGVNAASKYRATTARTGQAAVSLKYVEDFDASDYEKPRRK